MNIKDFITEIKSIQENGLHALTRGEVIDLLFGEKDNWILVLKALLIKTPVKYISISYLLEKLYFMDSNPNKPNAFLDGQGNLIYTALKFKF